MPKYSNDNDSNGVFARLIENWLASTPERGFEIPFCQLLVAEGHRIVHIDAHTQREDGKDVLSVDARGQLCGFQLKAGDVSVSRWRSEILEEVQELVNYPTHHPSFHGQFCRPYLVITGRMKETALHKLQMFNDGLPRRRARLQLVDKHALLNRFLACQRSVLPVDPVDFREFLQLVLSDGREVLNSEKFSGFLDGLLPQRRSAGLRSGELHRLLSGTLLLAGHAMWPHVQKENHFAEMQGWVLAAARVARAAASLTRRKNTTFDGVTLARDAAIEALARLSEEAMSSEWLTNGENLPAEGGAIWRVRATILAGCVALDRLISMATGSQRGSDDAAMKFLDRVLPHLMIWGESAAPYFLAVYWFMSRHASRQAEAESLLAYGYLKSLATANSVKQGPRVPSPYYRPEDCLRRLQNGDQFEHGRDSFFQTAFTALPVALVLARAGRRAALEDVWYHLIEIRHQVQAYPTINDFLRFRLPKGRLGAELLPQPTSWKWLQDLADRHLRDASESIPAVLRVDLPLALLFMLCHPQRLTPAFTLWLDAQVNSVPAAGS